MAVTSAYRDFVLEQLGRVAPVTSRAMFGGVGIYSDGLFFGLMDNDTLYLKVNDGNRGAFEAEGLAPFTYDGKGRTIVLPYWRVPERLFDEPEEMTVWARAALAAARRVAAKKKSKLKSGRARR